MAQHEVRLHSSFVHHFGDLDPVSQDEVLDIVKALEADAYFFPNGEEFVAQSSVDRRSWQVVCQHITGWCGYQMHWFLRYSDYAPSTPGNVIVRLRYQPIEDIPPLGHSPLG